MAVAFVLVLGLALIVYARTSRPAADASAPQIYTGETGDHWHGAYGFQLCSDTANVQLAGDLEQRDSSGNLVSQAMQATGIHSHDDGVIHWHAWSARAAGRRAQLGIFFDNYNISLSNDKLELPEGGDDRLAALVFPNGAPDNPDDFPLVYEEGETQCAGEDAELKVVVWTDYLDPNSDSQYTSNFDEILFDRNGLVVVIAFVPPEVDVVMPAWAARLPELGAIDSATGQLPTDGSVPSSDPTGTTADGTSPETTATDGTDPENTEVTDTNATSDSTEPDAADTIAEPAPDTTEDTSGSATTDG